MTYKTPQIRSIHAYYYFVFLSHIFLYPLTFQYDIRGIVIVDNLISSFAYTSFACSFFLLDFHIYFIPPHCNMDLFVREL